MKAILVYGSLKRGFWNHERFQLGEPTWTGPVKGFRLIDLGAYPGAVASEDSSSICERYEVSDDLFRMMDRMERGAGYRAIELPGGDNIWVYQYPSSDDVPVALNSEGHCEWLGGPRIL